MCTIYFQFSNWWKLALKIFAFKSHLFGGEGCASYLFNVQVSENLHWKIFVFKSQLFGGEGCAPYLTFKSVETCVEKYLHLSRIYSKVKDVHLIFSMFKSEETCIKRISFVLPMGIHSKFYRWIIFSFVLPMDIYSKSYR